MEALSTSNLPAVPLVRRGKVRDTYDLGDGLLLLVATDRLSAFDVVLPQAVPHKGAVLTQLSRYWFERTRDIVPNHLVTADLDAFPGHLRQDRRQLAGRAMIARHAERIDIECVVRGYLAGSAWAEYRTSGAVAGRPLPARLAQAERLPSPIFTPALKHDDGHDVTIDTPQLTREVGDRLAHRLEAISLDLYAFAAEVALSRGIILADTKFEFGMIDGRLSLIDEALTPDSSRFWDARAYRPGQDQPSFDKQPVRDWLERSGWNKQPPAPDLPADVIRATTARYVEAYQRITGDEFPPMAGRRLDG